MATSIVTLLTLMATLAIVAPGGQAAAVSYCFGRVVTVDIGAGQVPTSGNDVILGTSGRDTIYAGAGNDYVCSLGDNDRVYGGDGNDRIEGGSGNDTIRGEDGVDVVYGGDGNDVLVGGNSTDYLLGQNGDDRLYGQNGSDRLYGQNGNDRIYGQNDNDYLYGHAGADTIDGGAGNDRLYGHAGNDDLNGRSGTDYLDGGADGDNCIGETEQNCDDFNFIRTIGTNLGSSPAGALVIQIPYDPALTAITSCDSPYACVIGANVVRIGAIDVNGMSGPQTFGTLHAEGSQSALGAPVIVERATPQGAMLVNADPVDPCVAVPFGACQLDVNCDGRVAIVDALLIAQFAATNRTTVDNCADFLASPVSTIAAGYDLSGSGMIRGDANGDGNVTIVDALLISQCAAQIVISYPTCESFEATAPSGAWPGQATTGYSFLAGKDWSGLDYVATGPDTGTLWAVQNTNGKLAKVERVNGSWSPNVTEWETVGDVDAEGVTVADPASNLVYVGAEQLEDDIDNRVWAFAPTSQNQNALSAVRSWEIADTPGEGPPVPNKGIEAITYIPNADLGGLTNSADAEYDPAAYPQHGGGLFVVGRELSSTIRLLALDHVDGSVDYIKDIQLPGITQVMGLEYDEDTKALWATCDNNCGSTRAVVLWLDADTGDFEPVRNYQAPSGHGGYNNEGFALAPIADCSGGSRWALWSDDDLGPTPVREVTLEAGC